MRIGEVARQAGTTVRTIRYYEEIGLLPPTETRAAGAHRVYTEHDVVRLREILRLKQVLGVSLDELRELVAAQDARAVIRAEFRSGATTPRRRAELLDQAEELLERQLRLVARQREQLDALDAELMERRALIAHRREELSSGRPGRLATV
jgi:DNA-binding transcriptional MerR regulator